MSKRMIIKLVPTLQKDLSELTEEMGVSINELVNYALARFVEAQKGLAIIEERARRGSKTGFRRLLKKARKRDKKPEKEDMFEVESFISETEHERKRGKER